MPVRRSLGGRNALLTLLALLTTGTTLAAQAVDRDRWCRDDDSDRPRACEVREFTLAPTGTFRVDAAPNGGIEVTGGDESRVRVLARVTASARTEAEATALLQEVRVAAADGRVEADGPRGGRHRWWSVSYRVFVPRKTGLRLESINGGIDVSGVAGDMDLETTNGGLHLERVAGRVTGRTKNGSVELVLDGQRWDGEGVDLQTTNGSVRLWVPEDYSANVETGTVNGGLETDFPVTLQGRLRGRRLDLTLGSGGPRIRAVTTNGSVSLRRP